MSCSKDSRCESQEDVFGTCRYCGQGGIDSFVCDQCRKPWLDGWDEAYKTIRDNSRLLRALNDFLDSLGVDK